MSMIRLTPTALAVATVAGMVAWSGWALGGGEARPGKNGADAERKQREQSVVNLKMITLAMHSYHDVYGRMPPAVVRSKDGKPLYSWRVLILPFVEQGHLYNQFKLDEPWDGPNNKKLLDRMPKLYAPVVPGKAKDKHSTFYQVFVGKGTPFEVAAGPRIADFPDGLSNTILVVEAGQAVPWSKPADLHYAPDKPLPRLGGLFANRLHAAFADGSVVPVKKGCDEKTLRLCITRDDGEPIDLGKLSK